MTETATLTAVVEFYFKVTVSYTGEAFTEERRFATEIKRLENRVRFANNMLSSLRFQETRKKRENRGGALPFFAIFGAKNIM